MRKENNRDFRAQPPVAAPAGRYKVRAVLRRLPLVLLLFCCCTTGRGEVAATLRLPLDLTWWQRFGDPTLDSLVHLALQRNESVTKAMHQMELARLNWRTQQAKRLPDVTLDGGWKRSRSSSDLTRYWDAGATVSWEADLFGSLRKRVREQKENFLAGREEYRSTMVALSAQVATTYLQLRQYQQELQVVERNCDSQKRVMQLTEVRFETGLASKLDVAQARSVYYNSRSTIPTLEADIAATLNSLALLIGVFPEELRPRLRVPRPLPDYIEVVGKELPLNLLRQRPDVQAAEHTVAAQAAALGAAKADLLPQLSLTGSFGYEARDFGDLGKKSAQVWQIAPVLTWTLFNGGENELARRSAKIQWEEALDAYRYTLQSAVQEVESALSSYQYALKQTVLLKEVVLQGKEALSLSIELYKQGLTTFQNVLDSQRSLLTYEDSLVQAQATSLLSLVQLYQALGGGYVQP